MDIPLHKSYEVVGYAHEDGYYLCAICGAAEYEEQEKRGEDLPLTPVFMSQIDDIGHAICDRCGDSLDPEDWGAVICRKCYYHMEPHYEEKDVVFICPNCGNSLTLNAYIRGDHLKK